MASKLELGARAALCRELAKREPANGVLWIAEAENWSRLSNKKLHYDPERNRLPHLGKFAGAFRKGVFTVTANDNAVVLIERPGPRSRTILKASGPDF